MISEILNSPFLLAAIILLPILIGFFYKDKRDIKIFLLSFILTFAAGWALKKITTIPRPFIVNPQVLGISTNIPSDFSFPSLHTMFVTIFAWCLSLFLPKLSPLWFLIASVVALSRVFLGVHYYFDIYFGFILATLIFWLAFFLVNKKELIKPHSNIKRKFIHLLFGMSLVILLEQNILSSGQLLIIFLAGGAGIILSLLPQLSFLRKIIFHFERDKDHKLPAVTVWFYLLSSLITVLIFPKPIALAAITNLAIGDSVNALVGYFFNLPEGKKTVYASISALIATIIVSLNFVSFSQALIAGIITGTLELIGPSIKGERIDDNLWIPIVAGLSMMLV